MLNRCSPQPPHESDPKPMQQLLAHHTLRSLLQKVDEIKQANQLLFQILPKELIPRCLLLNVNHDTLVIAADNAAWATKLRYLQSDILWQFSKCDDFSHITRVHIRLKNPENL